MKEKEKRLVWCVEYHGTNGNLHSVTFVKEKNAQRFFDEIIESDVFPLNKRMYQVEDLGWVHNDSPLMEK